MVMAFCDANWLFFVAQHQGALLRNLPLPLPLPAMMNTERAGGAGVQIVVEEAESGESFE